MTDTELLALARGAAVHAYAPYSGYRVGAALLSGDGTVVTAANVENASYGLTLCAERAAFVAAVSRGLRDFRVMAVHAEGAAVPYPCGACLQVAQELAPAIRFVIGPAVESLELRELLPRPFGLEGA
jgi:cytidine deaminase